MSNIRVDNNQGVQQQPQVQQQPAAAPRPIELHVLSEFSAKTETVSLESGERIDLPSAMGAEDREILSSIFDPLTQEQRQTLTSAISEVVSALQADVGNPDFNSNSPVEGTASYTASQQALGVYDTLATHRNEGQAMRDFMAMGIAGVEQDLANFAWGLQENINRTNDMRTTITELQEMLDDWPEGETETFSWTEYHIDEDGNITVETHTEEPLTKEQAQDLKNRLETSLENMRGITQMQTFELQRMNQEYAQISQFMSNIAKSIHDTLKNTIRNLTA